MTVEELIGKLQKCNPLQEVLIMEGDRTKDYEADLGVCHRVFNGETQSRRIKDSLDPTAVYLLCVPRSQLDKNHADDIL